MARGYAGCPNSYFNDKNKSKWSWRGTKPSYEGRIHFVQIPHPRFDNSYDEIAVDGKKGLVFWL